MIGIGTVIMAWIGGFFIGMAVTAYIGMAYGENYTVEDDMVSGANFTYQYNLSESEIQDEMATQTCIALQINSPSCDLVYGGILDRPSDGRLN